MDLTIIIPAHNEEGIIIKTLENLKKAVKVPHKIIVIDDSTDNTEKIVNNYSRKHKNVSIIHGQPNTVSFSNALRIGFKSVSTNYLVVVMADLCDNPKTINQMYRKIKNWDVVCGSRYMKGGKKTGGPALQNHLSVFVCKSLRLLTGIPTLDVSNAFKMYRKDWLDRVKINPQSGVEASMEIVFQMYFKGARITEIPTSWEGRTIGKSKFKILKRAPRYLRIYLWALENSIRKLFHLNIKEFYIH